MSDKNPIPDIFGNVWSLKRLHRGVDKNAVSSFLSIILELKGDDLEEVRSSNFLGIFDNYDQKVAFYSKKSRGDVENLFKNDKIKVHLKTIFYKSDILSLFYEIFTNILGLGDQFNNEKIKTLAKLSDENSKLSKLKIDKLSAKLIEEFYNFLNSHTLLGDNKITNDRDIELSNLFNLTKTKAIASYILYLLENLGLENKPEEEVSEQEVSSQSDDASDDKQSSKSTSSATVPEDLSEGGDTTTDTSTTDPQIVKDPTQPLLDKDTLTDFEFRRQVGLLTNLSLQEYERIHDLEKGILTGSEELRNIFRDKSTIFMLTALSEGRIKNLSETSERLRLFKEYITFTTKDGDIVGELALRLGKTLPDVKRATPKQLEDIAQILAEGKTFTEYLQDESKKPDFNSKLSNNQVFNKSDNNNLDEVLKKQLIEAGVPLEKISLGVKNINDFVFANQRLKKPLEYFTEGYIQELQREYPSLKNLDQGDFKKFLGAYYQLKAAESGNPSNIGNSFDSTEEALRFFKNLTLKEQYEVAVDPQLRFLENLEAGNVSHKEFDYWEKGLEADLPPDENRKQLYIGRRQEYQQATWQQVYFKHSQRERVKILVHYGVDQIKAQVYSLNPSYVPQAFSINEIAGLDYAPGYATPGTDGTFSSPLYGNSYGNDPILSSPIESAQKLHNFNKKNRLADGAKNLFNRFGKNGAKNKAKEALEKSVSKAAKVAGNAVGGPLLGEIASIAASKKGKKKLVLIGGGIGAGILAGVAALMKGAYTAGFSILGAIGGGVAGFFIGGPVGAVIGATTLGGAGYGFGQWRANQAAGGGAGTIAQGATSPTLPTTPAGVAQAGAATTTTTQAGVLKSVMTATGVQAVAYSTGLMLGGSMLVFTIFNNAFLADFKQLEVLSTIDLQGRQSKYATVEKRVFLQGCPDNRCETPSFPIEAEYSIIISTKDNYTISIKSLIDEVQVHQNAEAWGGSPPNPDAPGEDLSQYVDQVIGPGERIEISYTQSFGPDFNHSSIINTITTEFYYVDQTTGEEGTDTAITGEVFFVGESSQGAGCWPTTGTMSQPPGGGFSHGDTDAFDISNSPGTNIYAPFAGTATKANIDPGYGNHVVITSSEGSFLFAHMSAIMFSDTRQVQAGDVIGRMGSTGNSTGSHLHFERQCDGKSWFGCSSVSQADSALGRLMPDGNTISTNSALRSCYD